MSLSDIVNLLPSLPGVYIFKDRDGATIYIGKASSLKNRVRSYFQENRETDVKTETLVSKIQDLEYIVTDNEMEALILENQLVKKNQPRYNILLKDDKSFPYIKLTIQEEYPRVFLTRTFRKDGSLFYGPYTSGWGAKETVHLIHKHFHLRTCRAPIDGGKKRPCLDYYIHRCLGPCVEELCDRNRYQEAVSSVRLLLEGKTDSLLAILTGKMREAAQKELFEEAALLREQIQAIGQLTERQKMILPSTDDADFFGFHQEGNRLALQVFTMRGSKILGRRQFFWENLEDFQAKEFLSETLSQYYLSGGYIPQEIFLPGAIEDQAILEEILTARRGKKVRILAPKTGDRNRLLQLVERNAHLAFQQRFRILEPSSEEILSDLQKCLELPEAPKRIECFDISNTQGTNSVASMVVCENGKMKPSDYRRYRIQTVQGPDDFASMHEVVFRRYRRILQENKALPGLILIDGGKGQLHAAGKALSALNLTSIPYASLAKEEEAIFLPQRKDPILLQHSSHTLRLLQRIRDEAHRFAVTFHRHRRQKQNLEVLLTQIPGIGEKTSQKLLLHFHSLKRLQEAPREEIIRQLGPKKAEVLIRHLADNLK